MGTVLEEVSETTIQLILEEPFCGHFFTGISREISDRAPSMAVGRTGNSFLLIVNEDFWREVLTSREMRCAVLKHEILHILLGHPQRIDEFPDARLFNVAADLVVNQHIETSQLPGGPVLLSSFPELDLHPDMGVRHYYEKLLPLCRRHEALIWKKAHSSDQEEEQSPSTPGEDDETESMKNLKGFLGREWSEHMVWRDFRNLAEAEKTLLEEGVYWAMQRPKKRVSKEGYGSLPGGIREFFEKLENSRKPQMDWRRVLRTFGESSRKTYLKNTIRMPSRRYGTTPGIRVRRHNRLLVAIDTSASVNKEELKAFFLELRHIHRQGAEITVVECDSVITNCYPYRGKEPEVITGGGGADFTPPIVFANEKLHPDAIVYFTDGYAEAPRVPCRYPILWLISDFSTEGASLWRHRCDLPGRVVGLRI